MKRQTTAYQDVGSLLPAARYAKSAQALCGVLTRARARAECYARLIQWPALVEHVQREADEIEAMWHAKAHEARR